MKVIRLKIIMIVIILLFCLLFYRSYQLTFDSPLPESFGRKFSEDVRRGIIYDSVGNELAISKEAASVGIRPTELVDIKKTVTLIAPILNLSSNEVMQSIQSHQNKNFFWLKRKIDMVIAQHLKEMKISGIHIRIEPSRYYPNKELASNLIQIKNLLLI